MDVLVTLEGPWGSRPLDRDELRKLVDPGAARLGGRWAEGMDAVPVRSLAGLVGPSAEITHATFHAADGYAASIPLEQAVDEGVLLVPGSTSGKVGTRLVVSEASSACVNVKAVQRIEFTVGKGKDTVDPNPHENQPVPGWDG